MNESVSTKDYFVLQHYASIYAGGWGARWARLGAEAFTTQSWVDWSPKTNRTGNCAELTVSVNVGGYGLTLPVTKCETWTFYKASTGVEFSNRWDGPVRNTNRELAYEIGVSVAQGGWPQWWLDARVQSDG